MEKLSKHGKESLNTVLLLALLWVGYQDHLTLTENSKSITAVEHALKWKLNINVEEGGKPLGQTKRYDASDISFAEITTEVKRKN